MRFEIREDDHRAIIEADDAQAAYEKFSRTRGRVPMRVPVESYTLIGGTRKARVQDQHIEHWPNWFDDARVKLRPLQTPMPQPQIEPMERAFRMWEIANRRRAL